MITEGPPEPANHLFGAESGVAVDGQCVLARMLWDDDDRPAAAAILGRILPEYTRMYGKEHPNTVQYEAMLRGAQS